MQIVLQVHVVCAWGGTREIYSKKVRTYVGGCVEYTHNTVQYITMVHRVYSTQLLCRDRRQDMVGCNGNHGTTRNKLPAGLTV